MTELIAIGAPLIFGVASVSVSFWLGWYLGRRALHREQFRLARNHRIKHELEHGR